MRCSSCCRVGALISGLISLGLSPGQGRCVVLLNNTLNTLSASLHPGVSQVYKFNAEGWPRNGRPSNPGGNYNYPRSVYSGAPAAQRAAKRSPIIVEKGTTRMHRNRNPCNSFLMVKMASSMDHRRVRPTTTTTTSMSHNMAAIHPANTKSCSLGLQH